MCHEAIQFYRKNTKVQQFKQAVFNFHWDPCILSIRIVITTRTLSIEKLKLVASRKTEQGYFSEGFAYYPLN